MLKASLLFFILGLLAMLMGTFGVLGLSVEIGEMILSVFFIFSLISFIGSAEIERRKHNLHH